MTDTIIDDDPFADDPFAAIAAQPDPSNESWYRKALCPQTDPEAFYPEKGGSTKEAKRICKLCPVTDKCLQWALDNDERFGVWGGLSERERRRLQRGADPLPEAEPVAPPTTLPIAPAATAADYDEFERRLAG